MEKLGIDGWSIAFQIINFGILMFLLKKFVYAPVLKVLDERANRIKDGLDAADKNIKLQKKLDDESQKIMADAKKQAQSIIKDAKVEADKLQKQAAEKAKTDAKKSLESERQAWESQKQAQLKKIESQLSKTIIDATNSVLSGSLDKKLQTQIIDKQIKKLDLKISA